MSDANLDDLSPLIAAGGNSPAARRARVKSQLRDRFGRWIEMGRSTKAKIRFNGKTISVVGKFVGGVQDRPGYGNFLVKNDPNVPDGVYQFKGRASQQVLASLDVADLERQGIKLGHDVNKNAIGDVLDEDIEDFEDIKREEIGELDEALATGELDDEGKYSQRLARAQNTRYESHNVVAEVDATKEDVAEGAEAVQEALAGPSSEQVRAGTLKAGDKVRVDGEVKTVKQNSSVDSGDMVTFTDGKFKIYQDNETADKVTEPASAEKTIAEIPQEQAQVPEDSATLARELNRLAGRSSELELTSNMARRAGATEQADEFDRQIAEIYKQYETVRAQYEASLPDTSAQDAIDNRQAVLDGIQWYDNKGGDLAKLITDGASGDEVLAWLDENSGAWGQAKNDFESAWAVDLPQPRQREIWSRFDKLNQRIAKLETATPEKPKTIAEIPQGVDKSVEDTVKDPDDDTTKLAEELTSRADTTLGDEASQLVAQIRTAITERDGKSLVNAASGLAMLARRREDVVAGEDKDSLEKVGRLRLLRSLAVEILQGSKNHDNKEKNEDKSQENAGLTEALVPETVEIANLPEGAEESVSDVASSLSTNEDQLDVAELTVGQAKLINSLREQKKIAMDAMARAAVRDDLAGYTRAKLIASLYANKINDVVAGFQEGKSEKDFFSGIDNRVDNMNIIKDSLEFGEGVTDDAGKQVLKKFEAIVIGKSGKPYLMKYDYDATYRSVSMYPIINGVPQLDTAVGFNRLGSGGYWHFEKSTPHARLRDRGYAVTPAYLSVSDRFQGDGLGGYLTLGAQFALESSGRRFTHSYHLLPSGNRSSKITNGHDPDLHSPSQIERLMYFQGSAVSKLMEKLGWYKGKRYGGGLTFSQNGGINVGRAFDKIRKNFDETNQNGKITSFTQEGPLWEMDAALQRIAEQWKNSSDRTGMPEIFRNYVENGDAGISDWSLVDIIKELAYSDGLTKQEAIVKLRAVADSLEGETSPSSLTRIRWTEIQKEIQTNINTLADALEESRLTEADKLRRRIVDTPNDLPTVASDPYTDGGGAEEMNAFVQSLGADAPVVERVVDGNIWSTAYHYMGHDGTLVTEESVSPNDRTAEIKPLQANQNLRLELRDGTQFDLGASDPNNVDDADFNVLDSEFDTRAIIRHPRTLARNFSTDILRSAYEDALTNGNDTVDVRRNGNASRVSILSIRDALQMQGVNTDEFVKNLDERAQRRISAPPQNIAVTRSGSYADSSRTELSVGDGGAKLTVTTREDDAANPIVLKVVHTSSAEDTVGKNLGQVVRNEDGTYNVYYFGADSGFSADADPLEDNTVTPIGTVSSRPSAMDYLDNRIATDLNLSRRPISVAYPDEVSRNGRLEASFTEVDPSAEDAKSVTDVRLGLSNDFLRVIERRSGNIVIRKDGRAVASVEEYGIGTWRTGYAESDGTVVTRYFSNMEDGKTWLGDRLSDVFNVDVNVITRGEATSRVKNPTSVMERQGVQQVSATSSLTGLPETRSHGRFVGSDGQVYPYVSVQRDISDQPNYAGLVSVVRIGKDSSPVSSYGDFVARHFTGEFSVRRNPAGGFDTSTRISNGPNTADVTSSDRSFQSEEDAQTFIEEEIKTYTGASDLDALSVEESEQPLETLEELRRRMQETAPAEPTVRTGEAPAAVTLGINGKDFTSRANGNRLTFYTPEGDEAASVDKLQDGTYQVNDPFSGDVEGVSSYGQALSKVSELIRTLDDAGMFKDEQEKETTAPEATPAPTPARRSTTVNRAYGRSAGRAQLVLDSVKNNYSDHEVLPNGDIKIASREYQMRGRNDNRKFRYEVVLHKKPNQDFVAYVREYEIDSNGNKIGDVTVGRLTDPAQSPSVVIKRINGLLQGNSAGKGINGSNPRNWFSNSGDKQTEAKDPATGALIPSTLLAGREEVRYIPGTGIPNTGDGARDAMIANISNALNVVTTEEQAQNIAKSIRDSWTDGRAGISKAQLDDILERLVANRNAPGANMIPYPSSDGKTIVRKGDRVKHKNGRTGVVRDRIRETRYDMASGTYSYEDIVYVAYDGESRWNRLTTKNLEVLSRADGTKPLPADVYEKSAPLGNAVVKKPSKKAEWDNDVEGGAIAYLGTDGVAGVDQTDPPTISMIKTRNGKYMVTIQVNGDAKPITRIFNSQQEADAWANSGLQKIINGEDVG